MLRYAKDNYVRITNMDNTMTEFFDSIEDYDAAAEWLSKYSFKEGGKMPLSVDFLPLLNFSAYFARKGIFIAFRAK